MSDPIIVNQSTSVVHVDTSTVVYPRNAVVLLSTITTPGTIITIRDVTGYASTNRGISVSTMAGVQFLDGPGCNVYNINQPYGFLTVTPRTSNVWAVLNTFAFPDQAATPSVVGVYAQFGNFSNLYGNTGTINNLTVNYSSFLNVSVVSSMLVKSISTQTLAVSERLSVVNLSTSSAFLSSVNINNSLLPSTSLDVNGSMRTSTLFITKDAYIDGSLVYNTSSIVSTVRGLGSGTYVSSLSLASTVRGLGTASYVSSSSLTSTVQGLGTSSYISSASLVSTVQGLGTALYISSASLISSIEGLGTAGYVSSYGPGLESTVRGLGSSGYVSSLDLISSIQGFASSGYVSSLHLISSIQGLGTTSYISSASLVSSIQGLGTTSYISSASLVSTVRGLGTSAYVSGPNILVSSLSTHNFLVYGTSTFINSSNIYLGNNFSTNALRFVGTTNDGYYGDTSINPHTTTVIAERIYNTNPAGPINNSELLLFKGAHDSNTIFGPDRVRVLTSGGFQVDIASNGGVWPINGNPPSTAIQAFLINTSGRVGISCNSPQYTLDVGGSINAYSVSANGIPFVTASNVTSTVQGLGSSSFVSSLNLVSTVQGLGSSSFVSSLNLVSTVQGLGTAGFVSSIGNDLSSTVRGLGSSSFVSSLNLVSTVQGLGSAGFVSSIGNDLLSTVRGLGSSSYLSSLHLASTVQGLGTAGYLSSFGSDLTSSVRGLGSSSYVSSLHLASTVQGLGTAGYLSSFGNVLISTNRGLGSLGYLSTPYITISSISSQSLVIFGANSSTILASCNIFIGNNPSTNAIRFIGTDRDAWNGNILINPYANTVIAERLYDTNDIQVGFSELLIFKGQNSATTIGAGTDRIRILSAGGLKIDIASNGGSWGINGNPPSTLVEALTVISTGWIGINCNFPAYTLDINGSINVLSNIYVNGQAILNNDTSTSTITGLGTAGYVSSLSLFSTVKGLGSSSYISSACLKSTVEGLGSSSYVSSLDLISTVQGLGTVGFLSSFGNELTSTVRGLASSSYVSSLHLASTVQGLGTAGYLSSFGNDFSSTVRGLGSSSYISSLDIVSTVQGLGTAGYVSSYGNDLSSTVRGLGTAGYLSSPYIRVSSISSQSLVVFGSNSSTILASCNIFIGNNPSTNAIRFIGTDKDSWDGNTLINPYANTVIAERLYFTNDIQVGFSELLLFKGQNSATTIGAGLDRVRVLSAGGFKIDIASNTGSWAINGNPPSTVLEALTVNSNGWMGISCNIPAYTLDINGSLNVLSNIYIDGQAILNNNTTRSTVRGLGAEGYVSSLSLASTVQGLGSSSFISSLSLVSTVQGLGTSGYVSSFANELLSTVRGLGSTQYISSLSLISTIQGLGSSGYISSLLVANVVNNSNMLIGNSFSTNMIRFYGTAYDSIAPFEDPGSQNASNFYATTVIAERLYYVSPTIEGCSELLLFKGKNAAEGTRQDSGPDRVRVLTTGGFKVDIASNGGIWLSNGNPPSTIIEALSVVPSGFVGINCNTPAYTLDVNGSINVTGSIIIAGTQNLSMANIVSTVRGLGTASYVSSLSLVSTVQGLSAVGVTPTNLVSTVQGLGTANYVSSVYGRVALTAMNLTSELIVKGNGNGVARITSDASATYFQSANNAQNAAFPINFTGYNGSPSLATIAANGNFSATGSVTAATGSVTAATGITATTGDIIATAGNVKGVDVIATSDFRLKTNIITIDSPLEKISAMRGVYFHKISDSTIRKVGVIAQEIETVLPEVVYTEDTEEKMKGVSYGNITSILIEGIKAQQSSIQSLVTTISSLQSQIVLLQRPVL